jgi:transposase
MRPFDDQGSDYGEPKSDPADDRLIVELLSGCSTTEAANRVGISRSTIWRRTRDASFAQRLADARTELFREITDQLRGHATSAIATLVELCQEAESETVRLGAARAVLDHTARTHEVHTLGARITALEEHSQRI